MGALEGKICIVTGSNSGIGKETVRGLAEAGGTVVLAVRDVTKGEVARADIAETTGAGARLFVRPLDLASLASVRAFAAAFAKEFGKLHVLVNNAGLSPVKKGATVDGLETTFAVNHVGPHLLTRELAPLLKASAPARVVYVASAVQKSATLDLDDLQFDRRPFGWEPAYSQSKLANVMDTISWSEELAGTGVIVNAVHPGVVSTELAREIWWLKPIAKLFFMTPAKGAESSLFAALDPSLEGVSGKYFEGRKPAKVNPVALDPAARAKLWAKTEELIASRLR